jgi:NAD(P)H-hydrate epimerase
VRVIDIGIPDGAPIDEPDIALIADAELLALLPSRQAGWTKFTSGHVLVAGGARGLTGAPSLACEAAQRAGPATSRPASPPRPSRSSPSGCSRR